MKIILASIAAAFLLVAGLGPASAAAGSALLENPSLVQGKSAVEKAGWGHRRWHRHRHYRGYRWGWRRHHHHRRWWW
jgi:hypothetical protein